MRARTVKRKSPRARKLPKLKEVDYLGINHEAVNKKVNPNVKFIRYMSISNLKDDGRFVAAVYFYPKPNKELGHSDYMLIFTHVDHNFESKIYITGRTKEQMKKDRIHQGTLCTQCNTVLVSLSGHHFHSCGCPNEMFVDGGQSKWGTRVGAKDLSKAVNVSVDMLTGKITILDKVRKRR